MRWLAPLCLLATIGCGTAEDPGPGTSGQAEAALGVFHRVHQGDAFNVQILEGGTFVANLLACDADATWSGRWEMDGEETVLRPSGDGEQLWREGVCPSRCFRWFDGVGAAPVTEVRFAREGDDAWRVTFRNASTGELNVQRWERGGLCVECGGRGQIACDSPF